MIIIFVAAMAGVMLEICRPVACLLLAMFVANLTGTIEVKESFSGFSSMVPWLLFLVLSIARVVTTTTLGMRLACFFMKHFGHGITGLSYSLVLTEFFVAPILPSNTARGASVGLPLVTSISKYISSHKAGISEKSVGAYFSILYAYSNAICSAMFLTAMISNALIVEAMNAIDVEISWISWFKFSVFPCIVLLILLPFILRGLCNPRVKNLENIKEQAAQNYRELGKLTGKEKIIILTFVAMLIMWVLAEFIHVPVFTTTLFGMCVFMFLGILDIKEVLSSYSTFNSVIMLGILISFVNCLNSLGAISWLSSIVSDSIGVLGTGMSFFVLVAIYFFLHYFFSGEGSRIVALYAPFLAIGVAMGFDKFTLAMTLALFSSLSDVLTNYTCPAAMTMFSLGYIAAKRWFFCGIIMAAIIFAVLFLYIGLFHKF